MAQSMQVIAYDYVLFAYTCNEPRSVQECTACCPPDTPHPVLSLFYIKPPALLSSEQPPLTCGLLITNISMYWQWTTFLELVLTHTHIIQPGIIGGETINYFLKINVFNKQRHSSTRHVVKRQGPASKKESFEQNAPEKVLYFIFSKYTYLMTNERLRSVTKSKVYGNCEWNGYKAPLTCYHTQTII